MAKLKDLCAVVGTYEKNGETKKRWQTIGALMSTNEGGQYILLDPVINLAAIPRQEGRDRVMISLFDPKENDKPIYGDDKFKKHTEAKANGYAPDPAMQGPLDDTIPF